MNRIELTDYYSNTPVKCEYGEKNGGMCHEGKGNLGYVCPFFVKFECGDWPNHVICRLGEGKQLALPLL